MNARTPFYLFVLAVIVFVLSACSSSYVKDAASPAQEAEAGPVEFERVVEVEKEIHFLSPNEEDVVVSPGTYSVEAVESTLRLTQSGEEGAQPVILQAQPTTHQQSIDVPEPFSIWPGEDMRVVMVLMPNGKAMQAVGSYSGVHSRGSKKMDFSRLKLPTVNAILTTPKLGALTPGGTLYIKGKDFGTAKGNVMLHFTKPVKQKIALSVEKWSTTKITAKIPGNMSGVIDQKAKLQVQNTKGLGGGAWMVPFYAAREGRKLSP